MKRLPLIIASLLLCLSVLTAGADSLLLPLYDAATDLLFHSENVTVTASVTCSLDGAFFKEAAVTHSQSGMDFYRDVYLTTPREDGSLRESGYTILSLDGQTTALRSYPPYVLDYDREDERVCILRHSVGVDNLVRLCRSVAELTESSLPEGAVTSEQEGAVVISLAGETTPGTVNTLLTNLLLYYGYATKGITYDDMALTAWGDVYDYTTVAEGILYCVSDAELASLNASIRLDESGRMSVVTGVAELAIFTRGGNTHSLKVDFSLEATDWGSTALPASSDLYSSRWWREEE